MNYLQLASVPEQSDFLQFFATEFSTFLGSKSVPLESDLSGIMMPPSTTTPQIPTFQEIFHNWKVFNVKQTQNYPNKISVPILVAKNIPRIEKKWARLIISLDRESINFIKVSVSLFRLLQSVFIECSNRFGQISIYFWVVQVD